LPVLYKALQETILKLSISLLLVRRITEGKKHITQGVDMTRQRTFPRPPEGIARAALVGLGLLVLLGNLDGAAALKLSCPLGDTAGTAVQVLASVVLTTASQALQALLFDHQRFFQGLFEMLLSFWLLTFVIVGAALLRAAFTGKVEAFREPNKDFREQKFATCRSGRPPFDA
jgi:hypothetical protein